MKCLILLFLFFPSLVSAFCFEDAGNAYEISPALLKSIAETESNMNPRAIGKNPNGSMDIGLMQINSFWIDKLGLDREKLLADPCYNTKAGAQVLRKCIDTYGYTWEAVGCYNAVSPSKRVSYSWKVYSKLKAEEKRAMQKKEAPKPADDRQNSTLLFSVRERDEDMPRERKGEKP